MDYFEANLVVCLGDGARCSMMQLWEAIVFLMLQCIGGQVGRECFCLDGLPDAWRAGTDRFSYSNDSLLGGLKLHCVGF